MIGAVLSPAIEALIVRAPVGLVHLAMKFPMRSVITRVSVVVVVANAAVAGTAMASTAAATRVLPMVMIHLQSKPRPCRSAERLHPPSQYGGEVEPRRNEPFSIHSLHAAKVEPP